MCAIIIIITTATVSKNASNSNTHGTSTQRQVDTYDRRNNAVFFGIPDDKDLSVISDVLQAVAGSCIAVKDTFRLGKKLKQLQQIRKQQVSNVSEKNGSLSTSHSPCAAQPSHPRLILIKLNYPWDRHIILTGKKQLLSISGMEKYFLQPDLPVDEHKKCRDAHLAQKKTSQESLASDSQ